MTESDLKKQILKLVREYADQAYRVRPFVEGETVVPSSGKVIGAEEISNMVDAALDGWLTTGRFNDAFEKRLAQFLGVKHVLTTNSGSSANLLAFSALTSPILGERAIKPGDEVISVAAGFPTTVNPIIQNGCVPVFVDVDIPTYNIDASLIETAVSEKTRAIVLAHTLGNPYDLTEVTRIARKYNLWLIEDCCDALGSTYTMPPSLLAGEGRGEGVGTGKPQLVGTFGDIGTLSFYPAHHITMGEGGAVFTNNSKLSGILESFRDWGRDCWCDPGKANTCGKRFGWQLGTLPFGYDHKYTYSHLGYNLKITDMQAACALAQMDRLPGFIEARKRNFELLYKGLSRFEEFLILPQATLNAEPSWFGFILTIRENAPFQREALTNFLESRKIATRLLFAGNITKQPYFQTIPHRIAGDLKNTDLIMNNSFWVGIYPGITVEMVEYVIDQFSEFFSSFKTT